MDAGAHPPRTQVGVQYGCPSRTSMNGDAGALVYNHSVETSEAQYGDIHTIHTLTCAERFSLQREQAVGLLRRDVRRRPRVARSSMIASK